MSRAYWDTSCILPLYVPEQATSELFSWACREREALTSSCILEFEFLFALQAKVMRGHLPIHLAGRARDQFFKDVKKGRFLLVPLGRDVAQCARDLSLPAPGKMEGAILRTLDGIHLATALQIGCNCFITADERLAVQASAAGLQVRKPNK